MFVEAKPMIPFQPQPATALSKATISGSQKSRKLKPKENQCYRSIRQTSAIFELAPSATMDNGGGNKAEAKRWLYTMNKLLSI